MKRAFLFGVTWSAGAGILTLAPGLASFDPIRTVLILALAGTALVAWRAARCSPANRSASHALGGLLLGYVSAIAGLLVAFHVLTLLW